MAAQTTTLTWAQTAALNPHTPRCLSCGAQLAPTLAWLASLRCHDCRDSQAPINRALVHAPIAARDCLAA
jgi:hypothetical protein